MAVRAGRPRSAGVRTSGRAVGRRDVRRSVHVGDASGSRRREAVPSVPGAADPAVAGALRTVRTGRFSRGDDALPGSGRARRGGTGGRTVRRVELRRTRAGVSRSQEIAEACAFLGADGLRVPSARDSSQGNLVVFCEQAVRGAGVLWSAATGWSISAEDGTAGGSQARARPARTGGWRRRPRGRFGGRAGDRARCARGSQDLRSP